jgi:hypothetical protein
MSTKRTKFFPAPELFRPRSKIRDLKRERRANTIERHVVERDVFAYCGEHGTFKVDPRCSIYQAAKAIHYYLTGYQCPECYRSWSSLGWCLIQDNADMMAEWDRELNREIADPAQQRNPIRWYEKAARDERQLNECLAQDREVSQYLTKM